MGEARSTQKDSPHEDYPYETESHSPELHNAESHNAEADTQARLHRVERQFAEIQRLVNFGSWEWDVATDVVTLSDELCRIFGVEPSELEQTYEAFIRRIHPDDRDVVDDAMKRASADRASFAVDHRLVRSDGDIRWLHSRGNIFAGEHGEPNLYGVAIDITDRRRSEQFLREFIGNAAHALGTPSAVIVQVAHVLADSSLGTADREAAMGALARQSTRLRELSTNLFDLVALDKDAPSVMFGLSMMLRPVPLADTVRKAAVASPPAKDATITIDIAADITVLAEPIELERVFVHLFDNAQIYGGPNVSVTANRMADEVSVDVRDDGPGLPNEYLPDLFAPFAKRRVAGQGSGLGLAVVHRLMEAFGGAISYRSGESHGSVFTLRFSAD
ncbi:MAG: PAS domain-containing protein [Phycicoccus sp.]|nr:PAS domain-containing protein [Phycicoccus sp.]